MEAAEELELMAPVSLSVVNFRYRLKDIVDEGVLRKFNIRIRIALQERGIAVPSSTVLRGRFAIRAAITHHRTRHDDLTALVDAVVTLGHELCE